MSPAERPDDSMKPFSAPQSSIGALDAECAGRLTAAAADVTLVVDAKGVVIDVAWGSDDLGRLGCAEWIGRPWLDTVTIESRPKVEALLRDAAGDAATIRRRRLREPPCASLPPAPPRSADGKPPRTGSRLRR
jgi:hypothetical protein